MSDNLTDPNINRNEHDDTGGVLAKRVKGYVWNPNTLVWDKMTQPGGGSGGADVQYTDGAAAVTHPVGTQPVYTDASGNVAAVSTTKPLPVASAVSDTFPATQNITTLDSGTTSTTVYNGQAFITGSPTAGSVATFALSGIQTTAIQITGTWTGSLRIEGSIDGGTTYTSKFSRLPGTVYAGAATVTANALLLAATSNYTHIRIRSMTSWTGTATIKVTESTNEHLVDVLNPVRLLDATTNSLMTINAASTAAIAANTSIVTALHPSSPLPAGTNVLGHVIVDSGSITTGGLTDTQLRATPVPVSGTFFQTTQPVSLATNTPTLQSGSTTAVTQATASNLNATVVGTGTFAVQATLAAETTKVIGVVRTADGSGNLLTSTSNALDVNIKTPSTLPVSLASVPSHAVTNAGTFAVQAAQSGTWNIGTVTTVSAVTAITNALPTGSNTIGAVTMAPSTTATLSNVSASVTSVTILASNSARRSATFYNESTSDCYIKYGTTASATSYTIYLPSNSSYYIKGEEYTGRLDAIWISAAGTMRVTETTA